MRDYDKDLIKNSLTIEQVFEILKEFGGEPIYSPLGIISLTICHNPANSGSRKLYYYTNSHLFHCYTHCENQSFDIFELISKAIKNQKGLEWTLRDSLIYLIKKFNLFDLGEEKQEIENDSLLILNNYERINSLEFSLDKPALKEYDNSILDKFIYPKIPMWEKENITDNIIKNRRIGYYLTEDQITIPHYDATNRLVGIRGRSVVELDAQIYGKYRPLKINNTLYSHPLGLNLYNLNNSKENIKIFKKAFVFESEKSTLQYASMFGIENDISVATCGFSISDYQVKLLTELGVEEIIIGFDKDFVETGDKIWQMQVKKYKDFYKKFSKYVKISFLFDKENNLLEHKMSPTDKDKETFLELFERRIML